MITVNNEWLTKYLKGLRHEGYNKTTYIADHLDFHFNGLDKSPVGADGKSPKKYLKNRIFQELIYLRRPSESEHIKEYRVNIYLSQTKAPCSKILNSLNKIVKAPDWHIDYSKSKTPPKVTEEESLESYCETNYPFFGSVESWVYSYGLKEILTDPNGLLVVAPISYELADKSELYKPFGYFVKSENVWDHTPEYVIFKTDKTAEYTESGKTYKGYVICILTKNEIWEATPVDTKNNYSLQIVHQHNFNKIPAFKAGGLFKEIIDNTPIYESFVSPILPGLDAAAREISDLDAEVVQHIFSTMWYYSTQDCQVCTGLGYQSKAGKQSICSTCGGSGAVAKSPYKDWIVKAPNTIDPSSKASPTPPAGYIEKNTEIVKIQDERIKNHIYGALSAINMEFLAETPLNQSGTAKEVDKDELNNFVYRIAYHLVQHVMKPLYGFIADYRYSILIPDEKARKEMLPQIIIPERFEILSEQYLSNQVTTAIANKMSGTIISTLELEYIAKKFANYPETRDKLITEKQLDPLPGITIQEISDLLLAGIITKEDSILSTYMTSFVERAVNEDPKFLDKKYQEKLDVLNGYVDEKIAESDAAEKIKQDMNAESMAQAQANIDPNIKAA